MDELVAKAAEDLQAGVDELAELVEEYNTDLFEHDISRTLEVAGKDLIAPLYSNKIKLPYMLRKGYLSDRATQQPALPELPPDVDTGGSDEGEIYVPDAEVQKELIEIAPGGAAEFVFLAGKTHVNAWEYLGDEWSSDIVRITIIHG
jgi:hypothetical protein